MGERKGEEALPRTTKGGLSSKLGRETPVDNYNCLVALGD